MNKDGWLYALSKAYLIGVGLVGVVYCLSYMPSVWQFLTGFTLTVVGWIHLRDAYCTCEERNDSENNNIKR